MGGVRVNKTIGSFKKGGSVAKTGTYKLHKGEKVLNAKEAKEKKDICAEKMK